MEITTKVFQVKTYDSDLRKELGGNGLYFAFGFSGMLEEKVCIYCLETENHTLLTKKRAKSILEYYEDEPVHKPLQNKIIKLFKKSSGY